MSEFDNVTILLAEDTATDAEMTIRALRKCNLANNLVWVKDGQEALDFLQMTGTFADRQPGRPRLILLDIKMPRVDGIQVLRYIRQSESLRTVPVVMLTSSAEERDIVDSYDLGATEAFYRAVTDVGMYWMLVNKVAV
jgi:two-component system response regulator